MKSLKEESHNYSPFVVLAIVALFAGGCSFFSTKHDRADADSRAFHQTASVDGMPIPLPVEIADDISRIASGDKIEQTQAWQVTSPGATAVPNQAGQTSEPSSVASSVASAAPGAPITRSISSTRHAPSGPPHNESYVVKQGDTLMKISFEKFGNVYRWREIYDANKGHIANFNQLAPGTVLNINGVEYVVITRNGNPYLIRRNDTLSKISAGLYGASSYWKSIWHNNPELIHDPNKIYTGFTLYYTEKPGLARPALTQTTSTAQPRIPASPSLSAARLPPENPPAVLPAKSSPTTSNEGATVSPELSPSVTLPPTDATDTSETPTEETQESPAQK